MGAGEGRVAGEVELFTKHFPHLICLIMSCQFLFFQHPKARTFTGDFVLQLIAWLVFLKFVVDFIRNVVIFVIPILTIFVKF